MIKPTGIPKLKKENVSVKILSTIRVDSAQIAVLSWTVSTAMVKISVHCAKMRATLTLSPKRENAYVKPHFGSTKQSVFSVQNQLTIVWIVAQTVKNAINVKARIENQTKTNPNVFVLTTNMKTKISNASTVIKIKIVFNVLLSLQMTA